MIPLDLAVASMPLSKIMASVALLIVLCRWCHDTGRAQAANKPLLKTTPLENLEPVLRDDIRKVSIVLSPVPQKATLARCLQRSVPWSRYKAWFPRLSITNRLHCVNFLTNMLTLYVELDVPGHAESWGVGYPALCPSKNCREPLDVSSDCTLKLINGVLS
ncbi:hypothetical protein Tco_1542582, partial [Tanacetum coccineum]